MQADVTLTVAEGKRLIAKGVAALPQVVKAKKQGLIVISTGSTNAYVVEEILGYSIEKRAYLTGHVKPAGVELELPEKLSDVVLKDGKLLEGIDRYEAARQLKAGDVFIKGANALNYDKKVAGVTAVSLSGGTVGGCLGFIVGQKATLVIPVGLEKLVVHDIQEIARVITRGDEQANEIPSLFPITGIIVTELEALQLLTGARAWHVASGGLAGAEGGIRLLLDGDREDVKKALDLIESIHGEPPFFAGDEILLRSE